MNTKPEVVDPENARLPSKSHVQVESRLGPNNEASRRESHQLA